MCMIAWYNRCHEIVKSKTVENAGLPASQPCQEHYYIRTGPTQSNCNDFLFKKVILKDIAIAPTTKKKNQTLFIYTVIHWSCSSQGYTRASGKTLTVSEASMKRTVYLNTLLIQLRSTCLKTDLTNSGTIWAFKDDRLTRPSIHKKR